MSENDDGPSGFNFGINLPIGEMLADLHENHQRSHMRATDYRNRVNEFLDGLSIEQLRALRLIFNAGSAKYAYSYNQYFDGMCAILLRRVYGVDPDDETGITLLPEAIPPE